MPSTTQTSALLVVGGAGGALLTYCVIRRMQRSERRRMSRRHPALIEAQDRRELLPSTIILVRHGESVGNADSTMWSTMPDNLLPLTERGIEQAKEAGRRVEHILSGRTKSMLPVADVDVRSSERSTASDASVYLHSRHGGGASTIVTGMFPFSRHSSSEPEQGYGNGSASTRTLRRVSSMHRHVRNDRIHLVLSPFERTLQTSRAMRTYLEHRIVRTDIESRIREQEFGNVQGEDFRFHREQQKKVGRFWYRFPTGESGADVYGRVKSWWYESVLQVNTRVGYEPVDAIVVVTHGLTMRFVLMQLFSWSPTTFHSVWNADNCEMYVLRKDLTKPGNSPYILDREAGDIPKSSIELWVEFKSGEKKTFTLNNYLSIPPPRTLRLDVVKSMLAKQYPEERIEIDDIVSIEFLPFITSGIDGEDVIQSRTPSGANCEKSDIIEQRGQRQKKADNHHRTKSQSNTFTQLAREHGLQRCDSCSCPIPTYNWMESY